MSLTTTDKTDPDLHTARHDGQNQKYLVLSEEERAKGFVCPVRHSYIHIGIKPKHPLRDLNAREQARFAAEGYVKFEQYSEDAMPVSGKYWTAQQLKGGCQAVTTMGLALAETYARDPKFYGSTFCCGCGKHFPVGEFVWEGTDELVGSLPASQPPVPPKLEVQAPPPPPKISIGPAQDHACALWETFKREELHFTDILECVAVLLINVADKSQSEDIEVIQWTRRLMADMRKHPIKTP